MGDLRAIEEVEQPEKHWLCDRVLWLKDGNKPVVSSNIPDEADYSYLAELRAKNVDFCAFRDEIDNKLIRIYFRSKKPAWWSSRVLEDELDDEIVAERVETQARHIKSHEEKGTGVRDNVKKALDRMLKQRRKTLRRKTRTKHYVPVSLPRESVPASAIPDAPTIPESYESESAPAAQVSLPAVEIPAVDKPAETLLLQSPAAIPAEVLTPAEQPALVTRVEQDDKDVQIEPNKISPSAEEYAETSEPAKADEAVSTKNNAEKIKRDAGRGRLEKIVSKVLLGEEFPDKIRMASVAAGVYKYLSTHYAASQKELKKALLKLGLNRREATRYTVHNPFLNDCEVKSISLDRAIAAVVYSNKRNLHPVVAGIDYGNTREQIFYYSDENLFLRRIIAPRIKCVVRNGEVKCFYKSRG